MVSPYIQREADLIAQRDPLQSVSEWVLDRIEAEYRDRGDYPARFALDLARRERLRRSLFPTKEQAKCA